MFHRLIILFLLSDESQVVLDSETPIEESEVIMDNDNLLQNAMPTSTGLDVSSTLKILPEKDATDEPKPEADFLSREVPLKLDEPPKNSRKKKAEAGAHSLMKLTSRQHKKSCLH